jgi:phosphatidylglycerophosphate synthase
MLTVQEPPGSRPRGIVGQPFALAQIPAQPPAIGGPGLEYHVQDRSILLPGYKRWLIEPLLPFIPRSIHPNTITHVGHLGNLAGLVILLVFGTARGGWPFYVAAALLNFYVWCDNADGGHARRTKQCSAMGELLDHGLDMFNATYMAYIGAASIGAPPIAWVLLVTLVSGACAATYWEQAETGTFHLGRLNQIEGLAVQTAMLLIAGALGTDVYTRLHLGPITMRTAMVAWVVAQTGFGIAHGLWRAAKQRAPLAPALPLLIFDGLVIAAVLLGAISTVPALVVVTAGNAFLGLRNLARRARGERPVIEPVIGAGIVVLLGVLAYARLGGDARRTSDLVVALGGGVVFGLLALASAADAARRVSALDRAARG